VRACNRRVRLFKEEAAPSRKRKRLLFGVRVVYEFPDAASSGNLSVKLKLTQRGRDRPYLTRDQIKAANRVTELSRIYRDQYPKGLPHNGLGVKYCKYMVRTMAFLPDDRRERWLERNGAWMDATTRGYLLRLGPHWYSPRSLGESLELYDEDRERLEAWTIKAFDVSDEEREVINQEKNRQAQERRRRKSGAKPQAHSERRTKPWEPMGISESTYRRRKRKNRDSISSRPLPLSLQLFLLFLRLPNQLLCRLFNWLLPRLFRFLLGHCVLAFHSANACNY